MTETHTQTLRRAAKKARKDARKFLPGGKDERLRLAVANYLGVCRLVIAIGHNTSEHSLKIARAYLGEN